MGKKGDDLQGDGSFQDEIESLKAQILKMDETSQAQQKKMKAELLASQAKIKEEMEISQKKIQASAQEQMDEFFTKFMKLQSNTP
jgi:2C-methyl-D-erythritol 2,4-cyclodiphosphate synthase